MLSDFVDHNEMESQNCDENDVMDVDLEATSMLKSLDVFYDHADILFCIGKLLFISTIMQWWSMYIWVLVGFMLLYLGLLNIERQIVSSCHGMVYNSGL